MFGLLPAGKGWGKVGLWSSSQSPQNFGWGFAVLSEPDSPQSPCGLRFPLSVYLPIIFR